MMKSDGASVNLMELSGCVGTDAHTQAPRQPEAVANLMISQCISQLVQANGLVQVQPKFCACDNRTGLVQPSHD